MVRAACAVPRFVVALALRGWGFLLSIQHTDGCFKVGRWLKGSRSVVQAERYVVGSVYFGLVLRRRRLTHARAEGTYRL